MTRGNALTTLLAFVIGWILLSFLIGTAITLSPILLAAVLIIIILIIRILDRTDALFVIIGLVVGGLVSLLVPALRPTFIEPGLSFAVLLYASLKV